MLLYRELDGLTLDKDVEAFRARLEDRFGPVPRETEELLRIVPLRRLAARLGAEKIFLKGGRMTLFFVSNPDSPFYQSKAFGKVIDYMMKYTRRCDLREQNGRRSMLIKDVTNVETAVSVLQEIVALPVKEALNELKMLSLATTHYYVAFISFSYLYYFFDLPNEFSFDSC